MTHLQVQYVLTEKVLDPRSVCQQLHLCSRESVDHAIKSTVDQKSSNDDRSAKTVDTKIDSKLDLKSRKPQVTFVQISDIHLDREYSEVCLISLSMNIGCTLHRILSN